MPRRSHQRPKYRLHKVRNQAIVSIDGKRHYLGTFDSPQSYEKYHGRRRGPGSDPEPARG